jgi:hypothetical protein
MMLNQEDVIHILMFFVGVSIGHIILLPDIRSLKRLCKAQDEYIKKLERRRDDDG